MKSRRSQAGDVVRIPLPDGTSVYGRMFKDSTIGVYFMRSDSIPHSSVFERSPDLIAGVFTTDFRNCGWIVCGHVPFHSEDHVWAPPLYSRDILNPTSVRIFHRGCLRQASEAEIQGLAEQLMFKPKQLAAEILVRLATANEPSSKLAEPGATDNPDDAQRI